MSDANHDAVDALLFEKYPSLKRAEDSIDYRTSGRNEVLAFLRPDTVGVELGVFAGQFSRVLLQLVQPRILHLVDPWWAVFGETYPDWGGYTDHGTLSTRAAYEAALQRTAAARGASTVHVHVATSYDWLSSVPDESLDWAYLDTTHTYDDTLMELTLLARKVRADGLILGDDYWTACGNVHYGVVQAVHAFIRSRPYLLIHADRHAQFALRREP
jgi:hypothetical protein